MNNTADTLKECHALVWKYRTELEPYWKTPTVEDALLFAGTELGEAIDAHLRSNADYARNRDKDLSILDELADMCLMLLTAMGPAWRFITWSRCPWNDDHTWSRYWSHLGYCISTQDTDAMATLIRDVATHPGMDLPARLTARLERIKAKRMPQYDMQKGYERYLLWARMDWQTHDVLTFEEWQAWANETKPATVEPPPSVGLIYKREPTPDEIAYGLEIEAQLGQAGAHE